MDTDVQGLEQEVITAMRLALANVDSDLSVVREQMNKAHGLFADHLMKWPEDFATLYQWMLEIYRAHTPMPTGHWRNTSVEVGYSSFPLKRWVADTVQPPRPTAIELVARFDALIQAWDARSEAIAECLTRKALLSPELLSR